MNCGTANGPWVLPHEPQVRRINREMPTHKPQALLHGLQMLPHESRTPLAGALKFIMIPGF